MFVLKYFFTFKVVFARSKEMHNSNLLSNCIIPLPPPKVYTPISNILMRVPLTHSFSDTLNNFYKLINGKSYFHLHTFAYC